MNQVNPRVQHLDAWTRAGIRHQVPMPELPGVFDSSYQKVAGLIAAAGGVVTGPAYACYFGMPSELVDVEIGFGIATPVAAAELIVTSVPATEAVIGTHIGSYDQLEDSYGELMTWLEEQSDLILSDHMYEFYDSEPGTDPSLTVTRLVFPLA